MWSCTQRCWRITSHGFKPYLIILLTTGLKLKPSKCHFFKEEITYLGHEISAKGILPGKKGIKEIAWMGLPTMYTGVSKFIRAVGYFRCFIKNTDSQAAEWPPELWEWQVEESPCLIDSRHWGSLLHVEEEMCHGTCIGLCRPEEALPAGDQRIQIRLGHHTAASTGGCKIPPSGVCKLRSAWKRGQLPLLKVGIPSPQVGRDAAVQGIPDVSALHHAN